MALQYFLPGDRGAWQATVQGLQRPTRRERLSTAHQTLNFSHLMGVKVSAEELKNVAMCIAWEGTRTLPQGCTILSCLFLPCLCIPSHPCFTSVSNYRLELREGHTL